MTDEPDKISRAIIRATQAGLPLTPRPYREIAGKVGISEQEVISRLRSMVEKGIIRRIGAAPNHYALGISANGMTVWDVDDNETGRLGERVGRLDFVSHCYRRPRCLPLWPYNLFAMVHGRSRDEVEEKAARIRQLLGRHCRAHEIIYSRRILKKSGLRI